MSDWKREGWVTVLCLSQHKKRAPKEQRIMTQSQIVWSQNKAYVWGAITWSLNSIFNLKYIYIFLIGSPKESIFLTTCYGLYFRHQYTNITNYNSSWYSYSNSNNAVTYFHLKILALALIWTRDLTGTKPICYQLSHPVKASFWGLINQCNSSLIYIFHHIIINLYHSNLWYFVWLSLPFCVCG